MKTLMTIFAVATLTGCIALPSKVAPRFAKAPGTYPISVTRGHCFAKDGLTFRIYLDKKLAGTVAAGDTITMYATHGRHVVAVGTGTRTRENGPYRSIPVDVSKSHEPMLKTNLSAGCFGLAYIEPLRK